MKQGFSDTLRYQPVEQFDNILPSDRSNSVVYLNIRFVQIFD